MSRESVVDVFLGCPKSVESFTSASRDTRGSLHVSMSTARCTVGASHPRAVSSRCRRATTAARASTRVVAKAADASPAHTCTRVALKAETLTVEAFAPFGQVCKAEEDGVEFGPADAQLDLSQGTPRFYVMRLREKDLSFDRITYHEKVTQCLGALGDEDWYMAVGAPTMDVAKYPRHDSTKAERALRVFRVPPGHFLKMHAGCWHAGPLFPSSVDVMDFYNLELSDTNAVDHNTHVFSEVDKIVYDVVDD
jgi:ureidoglycolate hydrolase